MRAQDEIAGLLHVCLFGAAALLGACAATGSDDFFDDSVGAGGVGGSGGDASVDRSTSPEGCGNGIVELPESCDGPNLNGENCATVTMGAVPNGTLGCTAACEFDTAGCTPSGTGGGGGGSGGTSGTGATGGGSGSGGTGGSGASGGSSGTGGSGGGTCNEAFCPSTFGTPCCLTANGPCGCDMGMGCMTCGSGGGGD